MSAIIDVHHWSSSTEPASASSAAARPTGLYGAASHRASSSCLAPSAASRCWSVAFPSSAASSSSASTAASADAALRTSSRRRARRGEQHGGRPGCGASNQPARRSGTIDIVPGEAAGSTYASSVAVAADAAFGPAIPAKNTVNATGTVTSPPSTAEELTAVPMISSTLPVVASAAWAISRSRRLPPNDASTSVAKPPKAVNVASWRFPMTWSVNANRPLITTAARTARIAASLDQCQICTRSRREHFRPSTRGSSRAAAPRRRARSRAREIQRPRRAAARECLRADRAPRAAPGFALTGDWCRDRGPPARPCLSPSLATRRSMS